MTLQSITGHIFARSTYKSKAQTIHFSELHFVSSCLWPNSTIIDLKVITIEHTHSICELAKCCRIFCFTSAEHLVFLWAFIPILCYTYRQICSVNSNFLFELDYFRISFLFFVRSPLFFVSVVLIVENAQLKAKHRCMKWTAHCFEHESFDIRTQIKRKKFYSYKNTMTDDIMWWMLQ